MVALDAGESPPIFYDLLYSAMARLERGDLRLTIIDAAVAAETFMRKAVQAGLSAGLDASLEEYSEDTGIRQVVNTYFPKCLDTEQRDTFKKTIKSNLHKLFDDRNDIMHLGHKEGLTESHSPPPNGLWPKAGKASPSLRSRRSGRVVLIACG